MRTLVIAGEYPWPVNSGSRTRLLTALGGLVRLGPTELFSIIPRRRTDLDPVDPGLGLQRVGRVEHPDSALTGFRRLSTMRRPLLPVGLPWQDAGPVEAAVRSFVHGTYDLIWCFGAPAYVMAGEPALGPTVVDLDDLEDQKILGRLGLPGSRRTGLPGAAHDLAGRALSRAEVWRWRRVYRRAGAASAAVVVCSDVDARRAQAIGVRRVEVVPNTCRSTGAVVRAASAGRPPTVLFQGTLRYPPNSDAARFLAEEVGPALRRQVPEAGIRLVGVAAPQVTALHDPPRVTVVGRVENMAAELGRADVVVVPIRYGSGTRVKVLEAFANGVPVASTSLGAEGLDVRDGRELLIADRAEELARACSRLLSDDGLRGHLVSNARTLFEERYRPEVVEARVAEVAMRAAGA